MYCDGDDCLDVMGIVIFVCCFDDVILYFGGGFLIDILFIWVYVLDI